MQSESAHLRPTHLKLVFNILGEMDEELRSSIEGPLLTLSSSFCTNLIVCSMAYAFHAE